MKNTKRRFVLFSFYDRSGIETYLEQQAESGWLLEKVSAFGWRFRRIEPRKIRFSVVYFSKASAFDPEPSEQQLVFQDFCEHTGWKIASSNAQMQIFYNDRADPTPIETDAVLEVAAIHAAVKKSFLPNYCLLAAAGMMNAALFVWRLLSDPVGVLASNASLFTGLCCALMLILSLTEIIGYYRWHKRAQAAAELDGSFTETKGHTNLQALILCVLLAAFALFLISCSGSKMSLIALSSVAVVMGITAIIVGISQLMKKMRLSAGVNRTATIILTIVLAFGFSGLLFIAISSNINSFRPEKTPAETYTYKGYTQNIYHDELPLTIEDLMDTEYDGYSYAIRTRDESLLIARWEAVQRPRMDALEQPELEYTVTTVKVPLLYDWCKNALLQDFAHHYGRPVPEDDLWEKHVAVDPALWKAREAYQLWLGGEPDMRFLLCYDGCIVEIDFSNGWELTAEQMGLVAEKLSPAKS